MRSFGSLFLIMSLLAAAQSSLAGPYNKELKCNQALWIGEYAGDTLEEATTAWRQAIEFQTKIYDQEKRKQRARDESMLPIDILKAPIDELKKYTDANSQLMVVYDIERATGADPNAEYKNVLLVTKNGALKVELPTPLRWTTGSVTNHVAFEDPLARTIVQVNLRFDSERLNEGFRISSKHTVADLEGHHYVRSLGLFEQNLETRLLIHRRLGEFIERISKPEKLRASYPGVSLLKKIKTLERALSLCDELIPFKSNGFWKEWVAAHERIKAIHVK